MESETSSASNTPVVFHHLLPAFVSALLISIGYVDPGKWAATVEGGAHFGFDLVLWVLLCNLAAILCQYLSARVGIVTGRDLAEICSEEYDKYLCLLLGIQTEFAVIAMDLTMVLGIAHGLNLLLGVDVFTCVFFTAIDAVFYPLLAAFLENRGEKFHCSFMAGFILFAYVFGILVSQPEVSVSMGGMLTNLSGEHTFALMSLLGASILPQNFYLHSALVRQNQGRPDVSKDVLCHDHFFATFCIFSCIYLASYMLMSSAANVFYNTGIVLLTFQDALTLVEQVFRIPAAPIFFLLILLGSSQVTALSWSVGGEVILHEFFGLDIPSWLHRVTVRIIAIIPALYCVWNTGAEGIYQLLIFMQVMVALLLPSSVIPLFRVASSRALMGVHKMSQIVGVLALVTLLVMGCLNVVFVVELIFGFSDWAGNLRWNFGGNSSAPYVFLLVTAFFSLSLTLWLLATPLKSASITQTWNWDFQMAVPETEPGLVDARLSREENLPEHEPTIPTVFKSSDCYPVIPAPSPGFDSHDVEHDLERHLTTIEEDQSSITFPEELIPTAKPVPISAIKNEIRDGPLVGAKALEPQATEPVEKTVGMEGDLPIKKDDGDVYKWEPEEASRSAPLSNPHLMSEGPGSLRSLTGKNDDGGNGAGSLSRLAGLGRAARRQLAAILEEFWGQLYDFHGQTTQEARDKKLDLLLGIDPKAVISTMRSDTSKLEAPGYFPSMSSSLFDSSEQQNVPGSLESPYGVQRGSSLLWSNQVRLLDEYVQNSRSGDAGERRYSSLRLPPSSEGWNNQPATVHGYQLASYLNRIQAERNTDRFSVQAEPPVQKSLTMGPPGYSDSRPYAVGQKLQNGLRPLQTSSYQNVAPSANSLMQSERSYYENLSPGPHSVGHSVNTKKYHSLPDISGASVYQRVLHGCDKNVRWDSHVDLGSSANRTAYEPSLLSNSAPRVGAALAFDDLSPSGKYRDALSMQLTSSSSDTASLWSRQPFEQFGVADKMRPVSGVIGSRSCSLTKEPTSSMDSEVMLLKSLRYSILKLLKLEGSDWLFKQNDGADEELIDRVAAREKFIYEAENREMNRLLGTIAEPQYFSSNERKLGASVRSDECSGNLLVSSVPHCGDECIWRADLIVSFGVWCIHRILDLSLMESRPELWGKYTYVLNRLQGIIDPAFLKPRSPMSPCFCLQLPGEYFQPFGGPPTSNGMLPPTSKPGRGKCTTAPMLLDIIKDVEIAISSRKGRTGTAAGDVAFPKGKENLASVLKRYKRRLSNRPAGGASEIMGSR